MSKCFAVFCVLGLLILMGGVYSVLLHGLRLDSAITIGFGGIATWFWHSRTPRDVFEAALFPCATEVSTFPEHALPPHLPPPDHGQEAQLTVDRVTGPGGQRWWSVSLVRAEDDRSALDGYPAIEWWPTRDKASEGYRARLRALRDAGWQRVE